MVNFAASTQKYIDGLLYPHSVLPLWDLEAARHSHNGVPEERVAPKSNSYVRLNIVADDVARVILDGFEVVLSPWMCSARHACWTTIA